MSIQLIVQTVSKLLADHGVEKELLGIDGTALQMLYAEAFGKQGIKDVHGKPNMDAARMIKIVDEIKLMRITCANSENAFADIVEAIQPPFRDDGRFRLRYGQPGSGGPGYHRLPDDRLGYRPH